MNPIEILTILAAVLFACLFWTSARKRRSGSLLNLANDNPLTVGTHLNGLLTGWLSSLYTIGSSAGWLTGNRFLLVKQGAYDNVYAPITSVLDKPVAITYDDPAAVYGTAGQEATGFRTLLGAGETRRLVAAGAITAGDFVLTNGDGTVKTAVGASAGAYWCVGVAVTSTTTAGDLVEVQTTIGQFLANPIT